ncbi:MAG: class II glutamine amidotransferase [Bdellovibrionales bacterium]|nr:class II glutamine amidotransferase [Bdellovibrionales bacterium]
MCRIFGFRSVLQSGVHQSLLDADNAIIQQSQRHPDGWGVAYYKMGSPHLIKMDNQAHNCRIFQKISGVVSSDTVIAHIRKSTVGEIGPLNTHPFQFGRWVFAHNGNISHFVKLKDEFLSAVDPELRSFILGDTDSEVLFYVLLTLIKQKGDLAEKVKWDFQDLLQTFVDKVQSIAGPLQMSNGDYDRNYLTFLLTNGRFMLGLQGGQGLFYSTHKAKCPERGQCSFFAEKCEKPSQAGDIVQHLLITSEQIRGDNVWNLMKFGEFVGVDDQLQLFSGQLAMSFLSESGE